MEVQFIKLFILKTLYRIASTIIRSNELNISPGRTVQRKQILNVAVQIFSNQFAV